MGVYMIPYFSCPDVWERFTVIAASWMGTPYRHLWMVKGRGADCSLFLAAILQELGVISRVEHSFYPKDWYLHTPTEAIKNEFANLVLKNVNPGFRIDEYLGGVSPETIRGDIFGFCMVPETGVTNHVGILLDPPTDFLNSIQRRGVSKMHWGSYWKERVSVTYRVMYERV